MLTFIVLEIVISFCIFCSIVNSNIPQNDCHGGASLIDNFYHPCDCTGISRRGRYCNDPLRPGLILVPEGRKPNTALENERRHAQVMPGKMDRILYNETTDTIIGIFDALVYSVYFDKATVDEICSIPTDTCDITEDEILAKIRDKIECRQHLEHHTLYGTCSAPNTLNANEEQTFMKILDTKTTRGFWNLQILKERCSIPLNTRNNTGLVGCRHYAVIVNPQKYYNRHNLVNIQESPPSQNSLFSLRNFSIGIIVGISGCGVVVMIGVLILIGYLHSRTKRNAKAPYKTTSVSQNSTSAPFLGF